MSKVDEKSNRMRAVAEAVAQILAQSGPAALTPSSVARQAGVSRPWLYEYVGKGDELLSFAIDEIGREFAELGSPIQARTRAELLSELRAGSERMFQKAASHPTLITLYFRYSHLEGPIGSRMREIEGAYLQALARTIASCCKASAKDSQTAAELLTSLRLSLCLRFAREKRREPLRDASFAHAFGKSLEALIP